MGNAIVPGITIDAFEDQVFSIFGAIRDAGFSGQIQGPEWTLLINGKEAARIVLEDFNSETFVPWTLDLGLIREPDSTVTLNVRPFKEAWRLVGSNLNYFQLYQTVIYETIRGINTYSPPLRLYLDLQDDDAEIPENVAVFPIDKSYLYPSE